MKIHRVAGGGLALWTDDDHAIHMKIRGSSDGPIELNETEPESLAEPLLMLAK